MKEENRVIFKLLSKISALESIIQEQVWIIELQKKVIAEQSEKINHLTIRTAELEKRLKQTSQNSSKPPSSDALNKRPRQRSLREHGKNKSGGQLGHQGKTLNQVSNPDKIEKHPLNHCPDCGHSLGNKAVLQVIKRQVFDIPVPKLEVTEHQAQSKYCECCHKIVVARFPRDVTSPVQYGKVIRSWAVYYQNQHFIPQDRLQQLFVDLYGVSLATDTLAHYNQIAYTKLAHFEQTSLLMASQAAVKHLDETGFRVQGKTAWLHTLSTDYLTYYHVSSKRKSLIEGLSGLVVHDHWRAYYQLEGVEHALCNQHHLRELKSLIEHEHEPWAARMSRFLKLALRYRHWYGNRMIPLHRLNQFEKIYAHIIQDGLAFHHRLEPLPSSSKRGGKKKRRPGHNLLLRFYYYKPDILRFLYDPQSPFTNNEAERDLRMAKCKQKISGGFRSEEGAKQFARIRGFINTARKQGWNIFNSIQAVFTNSIPLPTLG